MESENVSFSCVQLFVIPWTVACKAPKSVEFSGQEHWSGLPLSSSGDLPDPGIEPESPALQADSLPSDHQGSPYQYNWSPYKGHHMGGL